MRLRIQLLGLSLAASLSLAATTRAQERTAEDFFHGGALHYLSNNVPAALQVVTNGLQVYPGDEKLKKLYELLNQQQQQNQQNQQDQKDQQQDQQKDQKKDEQKQQDQQQSQNDQQKKEEEKKQDQQKSGGDKSKDQKEEKGQEAQPMEAHAMTPQEAKQLLDAQKGDEQVLIFQPQGEPKNRTKQLKDW
jgi:hypothetical protein